MVFRVENQHCASWGVAVSDLASADPPVCIQDRAGGWEPFLDRVSVACVEMVLSEVLLGCEHLGISTAEVRDVAGRSCPFGQHPGCGTGGAPVPPDAVSPARATSRNDMNVTFMSLLRHECGIDVVTVGRGG